MVGYVADESLRGNLPFPRAREDELLYVLHKLLELRLWPGSMWAALSENPTKSCVEQPAIDTTLTPSELIADAIKRSLVAHLFHFYPVLCDIASIPRKTPSAWVMAKVPLAPTLPAGSRLHSNETQLPQNNLSGSEPSGKAVELDARTLARQCLREIGKEMGVRQ